MLRILLTPLFAPLLALLLALPVSALAAPPATPIRIGVYGPFTGGSSPMGLAMRDGIRLATNEINASGGVLGRPLQLVEYDDEANNQRGSQIAQRLIQLDRVVAAVGIANTGVALASQHYFQEARLPVMTAVATGTIITKQFLPPQYPENYVFRVSNHDALQAAMIVEDAVERRHFRRLAIIHDSTNYGQLGREDLERALAVATTFHYLPLHLSPMGRSLGYSEGDFPVTESVSGRLLRLPIYPALSAAEQGAVIATMKEFLLS